MKMSFILAFDLSREMNAARVRSLSFKNQIKLSALHNKNHENCNTYYKN